MTDQAKNIIKDAHTEALFSAAHAALPMVVRQAALAAKMRRVHYDASIAEGFTACEALTLCIASIPGK